MISLLWMRKRPAYFIADDELTDRKSDHIEPSYLRVSVLASCSNISNKIAAIPFVSASK